MDRDPQKDLELCAGPRPATPVGMAAWTEQVVASLSYWIRRAEEFRERYNAVSLQLDGMREHDKLKLARELEEELGTNDSGEAVKRVREMREECARLQEENQRLVFAAAKNVGGLCDEATGLRASLAEVREREKRYREALLDVLEAYLDIAPYHVCCGPAHQKRTVDCRPGECREDCYYANAARTAKKALHNEGEKANV